MLKVLVVDDEPKVRRGVSGLISMYPEKYELLGSCGNSEETIHFFEKAIPDVIVTDICMPKQDGLEMISYLKHRYHNLDFVILSGYSDFEYAKKALQYRVFDFLLKPLKPEDLFETLDRVWEKRKSSYVTKAQSLEDNHFFNLIRTGEKETEEKNLRALGLYDRTGRYCVGVLDFGELPHVLDKGTELLKTSVRKYFPEAAYMFTCFDHQVVLGWEREIENEELKRAISGIEQELGGRVYLGISLKSEKGKEFRNRYFQALDAAKLHIYNSEKRLSFYRELSEKDRPIFPDELCERLLNAIRTGSVIHTKRLIGEFLTCYRICACRILLLKQHLMLLEKRIEMLTEELGMESEQAKELLAFVRNIEEISSFSQVEDIWMEKLEKLALEAGETVKRKMNSFYLNQILEFIQKNYSRNLSLEDVAEHVNLSAGYLGNYFKQKTGMNFTDYLGQLRLERAKSLLIHTNEKIYRIAELAGYQNSQYFVTAFKKKTGLTPAEYRKCLSESEVLKKDGER